MLNSIVALAGLAYASYTDLRETIVPDNLNYALIIFGLLYHIYLSATTQSLSPITLSIAGATLAFVFSYILWRMGAWAGGDVKLFTALVTKRRLRYVFITAFATESGRRFLL